MRREEKNTFMKQQEHRINRPIVVMHLIALSNVCYLHYLPRIARAAVTYLTQWFILLAPLLSSPSSFSSTNYSVLISGKWAFKRKLIDDRIKRE